MRQKDTTTDTTLRMYAIIRGDLHMTPGKAASQAGHAFKLLTKNIIENDPQTAESYFGDGGIGTNVCLVSKNLNKIMLAHERCKQQNIPSFLVVDEGHVMPPHFDGSPIVTALAIGPAKREDVKQITKRFNLYN